MRPSVIPFPTPKDRLVRIATENYELAKRNEAEARAAYTGLDAVACIRWKRARVRLEEARELWLQAMHDRSIHASK